MTEHSFVITGAAEEVAAPEPEFTLETIAGEADKLPRVDPARGVFITSRGDEIRLADKPINSLIVERIKSEGKPSIPQVEVLLLGKHRQLEYNPNHEGYLARLKEWEEESQMKLVRYLFVTGVKGQPPQEFIDEQAAFFPMVSDGEMKYLWIASLVPDDDLEMFTEAIMGRFLPTTKGIEESAATFPGDSERSASQSV